MPPGCHKLPCLVFFIYQLRYRDALLGSFPFFTRLKKKYTHRILKLGLPVATLNTLFAFVNMFLCRTASTHGGHIGLMTFTTGGQIEAITWNTSQGFSTALSAFIAQNYAAGRTERVIRAWHMTLWMTGIFGTFCTLLFVFFGNEIFAVFVPEQAAYEAGGGILKDRRIFTTIHDAGNYHARSILWHRAYSSAGYYQHHM